jgi:chromosome segregation ATPase
MARNLEFLPRAAIFLAGIAAGALVGSRRERVGMDPAATADLKRSLVGLEERLTQQEAANDSRFRAMESRLQEHDAKLANVPSTTQMVAAMEQLLAKAVSNFDEKLSKQADSIEGLRTTVSQTDNLLARVLESLDSLQTYTELADAPDDLLLREQAV